MTRMKLVWDTMATLERTSGIFRWSISRFTDPLDLATPLSLQGYSRVRHCERLGQDQVDNQGPGHRLCPLCLAQCPKRRPHRTGCYIHLARRGKHKYTTPSTAL